MSARSKSTTTKTAKSYDYNNAMSSSPRTSSPFLTYPSAYTSDPFPYLPTASRFGHHHPASTSSCVPTAAMCDYPFASTSGQCGGGYGAPDEYENERAYHRAKASTSSNMYGGAGGHSSYEPTAAGMMSGHPYGPTSADMYGTSPYGPTAANMYGHSCYDPTSADMYGRYGPTAADVYGNYMSTNAHAGGVGPYGGTSINFLPSPDFMWRNLPFVYPTGTVHDQSGETWKRVISDSSKFAVAGACGSLLYNGIRDGPYA